jgi:hypothetical protein
MKRLRKSRISSVINDLDGVSIEPVSDIDDVIEEAE